MDLIWIYHIRGLFLNGDHRDPALWTRWIQHRKKLLQRWKRTWAVVVGYFFVLFSYVYLCFVLFRCVVIWTVLSPVLLVLFMILVLYMMIFVGHVFYFLQNVFLLPCVISNLLVVFLSFSLVSFLISLFVTSSLSDMVVSWKCTLTRCKVRRCSQLLQMWGSELLSRSLRILQTKAWFNKKPEKESSTFCVNVCSHINIHGLSYSTVYCTLYTMHNCLKRCARGGRFSEECQGDDQNSYCLIAGGATMTKFCQWVKPPKTAVNPARVKPALSLLFCTIWSPWQEQNEDQEKQKFCVGGAQKDWIWCEWYQSYSGNCEKMQQDQQVWWWWWWFWSDSLVDKLHRSQGCRHLIQMCI